MPVTATTRRTPVAARRIGYIAASVILFWMLVGLNLLPGWDAVPFLTRDTDQVLLLVNLSLAVSLLANVAYIAYDPAWVRSLGDVVTAMVGLAALARVWEVFPFDFSAYSFDWALLVRLVLGVAIVGSVIGVIVNLVNLAARSR
jgi:hypothetical protein